MDNLTWQDMWYSNSKRTKLHREIEEDIQWIEENVEQPLLDVNKALIDVNKALKNRIKELEELIDKAKPSEECA